MKTYVAVTDQRWYQFLAARPYLTEANFWMPGGGPAVFGAVAPGESFLFKTHRPHNRLVGGGFLSDYRQLPLETAWERFGEANGVASLEEMRAAIGQYRRRALDPYENPVIGCAMLRDTAFFELADLRPTSAEFAGNLVRGKSFEIGRQPDSTVEEAFRRLLDVSPSGLTPMDLAYVDERAMFGSPRLYTPRLGQRSFAAVIESAYGGRCAITGAKIRPALQAAHIRPVAQAGQHRVDNGLLLRADVHIMFDRGYLGVHPSTHGLQVSSRLRQDFGNGDEFYVREGEPIAVPTKPVERPNTEFLEWHLDEVFHG